MAAINWAFQAKLCIIIVIYLSIVVIFYSYMSQLFANGNIPYATEIKIHFSYLDYLCYTKYANAGSQKGLNEKEKDSLAQGKSITIAEEISLHPYQPRYSLATLAVGSSLVLMLEHASHAFLC